MELSRRIIALSTVIAVVFGPQWCCCTFKASESRVAHAATKGGECCCCCETPASCPTESGSHDDGSCPCRSKSRTVAAPVAGVGGGDLNLPSWSDWQGTWPIACGPAMQSVPSADEGVRRPALGEVPTLGGRALLRALSMLRC
ncbi:MAG: hypothetical protein DWI04_04090 [Planctomycetota bacterium]|nr:MAG: hypothetical protein DWI04_04090 [Planctomycetota bacterium]